MKRRRRQANCCRWRYTRKWRQRERWWRRQRLVLGIGQFLPIAKNAGLKQHKQEGHAQALKTHENFCCSQVAASLPRCSHPLARHAGHPTPAEGLPSHRAAGSPPRSRCCQSWNWHKLHTTMIESKSQRALQRLPNYPPPMCRHSEPPLRRFEPVQITSSLVV